MSESGGGEGGGGDGNVDEMQAALMGFAMNELTNSSSKLMYDFACFEFMNQRETLITALAAAIEGDRLVPKESGLKDSRTYDDLLFCEDVEFVQTFRLTRNTVKILVTDLKRSGFRPMDGELATEHALLLLLWYLGSAERDLTLASRTFSLVKDDISGGEIEGQRIARRVLVEVATAVATLLPELGGVTWPNPTEMVDIERNLARRHKFPSLTGVLGFFLFIPRPDETTSGRAPQHPPPLPPAGSNKQPVVALQAVVDDRQRFRDLHAIVRPSQHEATPGSVLLNSPLFHRIKQPIMGKLHLLAGNAYPQWGCLLTPYVDDGTLLEGEKTYNRGHDSAMSGLRQTFSNLLDRFPKLGSLDMTAHDCQPIILAAAIIHNYCLVYHDVAPIA